MSVVDTKAVDRRAWKLTAIYTAIAVAAFIAIRRLPLATGTLHYTDFHAGGKSFLEFCEPGSPQFAPVDRVQSPVKLAIIVDPPEAPGSVNARARLTTDSGKPVTAEDLLVVHTQKLHLLIIDSSLDDYHHVHPQPTGAPGEFAFAFTPRHGGRYRVFADFTPRATGRALYAGAMLAVDEMDARTTVPGLETRTWTEVERGSLVFRLHTGGEALRINQPADISLSVSRRDGAPVVLEEIMAARAHLVAFDAGCTGFAHLHPKEASPLASDDGGQRLAFTLSLADPGHYRLWAQVKIDGAEVFAPFGLRVEP